MKKYYLGNIIVCQSKKVTILNFRFEKSILNHTDILLNKMLDTKMVKKQRIGMTNLMLVNVDDALLCVKDMIRKKEFFYDFE